MTTTPNNNAAEAWFAMQAAYVPADPEVINRDFRTPVSTWGWCDEGIGLAPDGSAIQVGRCWGPTCDCFSNAWRRIPGLTPEDEERLNHAHRWSAGQFAWYLGLKEGTDEWKKLHDIVRDLADKPDEFVKAVNDLTSTDEEDEPSPPPVQG
jgi:hypothetical protein